MVGSPVPNEQATRRRVLFPLLLLACCACGDNRGGDVPAIRAALEKLPGVRVIDVVGWDEMWPIAGPEDIRADLQVGSSGHLVLCNLTVKAVTAGGPFIIARVGNWVPQARTDRDTTRVRHVAGCPNSVDVRPDSALVQLLPFPLQSPADAVANYDRLLAIVESWPDKPTRCPSKDGVGYIEYWKTVFQEEAVETRGRPTSGCS
jgi:hypothetical protein